jgi:hypothetical protein
VFWLVGLFCWELLGARPGPLLLFANYSSPLLSAQKNHMIEFIQQYQINDTSCPSQMRKGTCSFVRNIILNKLYLFLSHVLVIAMDYLSCAFYANGVGVLVSLYKSRKLLWISILYMYIRICTFIIYVLFYFNANYLKTK